MYITKPYHVFILNLNLRTCHAPNQLVIVEGLVTLNIAVVFKAQKENITIGHTSLIFFYHNCLVICLPRTPLGLL